MSGAGSTDALDKNSFIESMKKLVTDPSLKSKLEGPLPLFFHAVDANDDGMISGDEYTLFFDVSYMDLALELTLEQQNKILPKHFDL